LIAEPRPQREEEQQNGSNQERNHQQGTKPPRAPLHDPRLCSSPGPSGEARPPTEDAADVGGPSEVGSLSQAEAVEPEAVRVVEPVTE
jgi:hypothetical protein